MQFHLNGFKAGDPALFNVAASANQRPANLPAEADVRSEERRVGKEC